MFLSKLFLPEACLLFYSWTADVTVSSLTINRALSSSMICCWASVTFSTSDVLPGQKSCFLCGMKWCNCFVSRVTSWVFIETVHWEVMQDGYNIFVWNLGHTELKKKMKQNKGCWSSMSTPPHSRYRWLFTYKYDPAATLQLIITGEKQTTMWLVWEPYRAMSVWMTAAEQGVD